MDMSDAPNYPSGGINPYSSEWENSYFLRSLRKDLLNKALLARKKVGVESLEIKKQLQKLSR